MSSDGNAMITAVLTSCSRHDLLVETLDSFFSTDGGMVDRTIVVEDGPPISSSVRDRYAARRIDWIDTGRRVGQVAAIDYAYSRVGTPYVFHLEDDWQFLKPGYLNRSLTVLRRNPKCLQVWLRPLDDMQGHPLLPHEYVDDGIAWRRLAFSYLGAWHGFSWNPGLRRLADYVSIGGFGVHARFDPKLAHSAERRIGQIFRERDFFAAALSDGGGSGYVKHIGEGRHVGPTSGAAE